MKVLIVEDDTVSRLVLVTKLGKLGHEVIEAQDGEEGLQAFVRERPGIVITDWMMPGKDGLQLCNAIRAGDWSKYTYIIMLTALTGKKKSLEGMAAGADDFLDKPVDMDELETRLRVAERILSLQGEVKQLEGLLPICTHCKKIRVADDEWQVVELYIRDKTESTFSHGICPDCYETIVKPQCDALSHKRT